MTQITIKGATHITRWCDDEDAIPAPRFESLTLSTDTATVVPTIEFHVKECGPLPLFCGEMASLLEFYGTKNGVFWDVTPCGSCKSRRFGGT
jgi:hypothetical protein